MKGPEPASGPFVLKARNPPCRPVVDTRDAARLVGEHRLDDDPFAIVPSARPERGDKRT